ncbi:MAG: hypothetical protein JWR37_5943 [Mycobacterium sp.]|jgi:hypothetical protein|nr:hypothetical protein [Mycobacterium sp.]
MLFLQSATMRRVRVASLREVPLRFLSPGEARTAARTPLFAGTNLHAPPQKPEWISA